MFSKNTSLFPLCLLVLYVVEATLLGIAPVDRSVWWAENLTAWIPIGVILLMYWTIIEMNSLATPPIGLFSSTGFALFNLTPDYGSKQTEGHLDVGRIFIKDGLFPLHSFRFRLQGCFGMDCCVHSRSFA